jgi:hypothetical protein
MTGILIHGDAVLKNHGSEGLKESVRRGFKCS